MNKGVTATIKSSSAIPYGNNYNGDDLIIRFYSLDGDSCLASEYFDDNKHLYNEKSLGIFHKQTERLFQVRPLSVRRITNFLRRSVRREHSKYVC